MKLVVGLHVHVIKILLTSKIDDPRFGKFNTKFKVSTLSNIIQGLCRYLEIKTCVFAARMMTSSFFTASE
jgi:hypothetical protein